MNDKDTKKEITSASSTDSLISFDNLLLRLWPKLLDWNFPSSGALEKGIPKVDIIKHDNEPGCFTWR
jgi:hypothetical protein